MYKGVHRLGVEKVKAIIAEIDKKHMIVITDKGDFVKVKRQMSAAIGDEIELKQRRIYPLSLIHISEPTRLLSISYAVFCLKKKKKIIQTTHTHSLQTVMTHSMTTQHMPHT